MRGQYARPPELNRSGSATKSPIIVRGRSAGRDIAGADGVLAGNKADEAPVLGRLPAAYV